MPLVERVEIGEAQVYQHSYPPRIARAKDREIRTGLIYHRQRVDQNRLPVHDTHLRPLLFRLLENTKRPPAPPKPILTTEELEYWSNARLLAIRASQGRAIIYERFIAGVERPRQSFARHSNTGEPNGLGTKARVASIDGRTGDWIWAKTFAKIRQHARTSTINEGSRSTGPHDTARAPPIIIVQDYNKEIISILGHSLEVPVGFFADHFTTDEGTVHLDAIREFPTVGSGQRQENPGQDTRVIIRYPVIAPREAMWPMSTLPPTPGSARSGESTYADWVVERQIETPSMHDELDREGLVVTVSAQMSYWIKGKGKVGEDSMILLVDPPIFRRDDPPSGLRNLVRLAEFEDPRLYKATALSHTLNRDFPVTPNPPSLPVPPIQRGQPDPPPPQQVFSSIPLFSNTDLSDDIILSCAHQHLLRTPAGPKDLQAELLAFARRFAQNHWIALINHARGCLNQLRSKLYSPGIRVEKNGASSYTPKYAGGPFSEWVLERLADWSTALTLYTLDVEANMVALGINLDIPDCNGTVTKQEAQRWRYIYKTLGVYRDLYRQTADSYTQVNSLREAQAVGKLTRLGVFFLPAGFVAGLLSMGGEFLPGQAMFWVFWVAALPTVILVLGLLSWEGGGGFGGTGNRLRDNLGRYWRRVVTGL